MKKSTTDITDEELLILVKVKRNTTESFHSNVIMDSWKQNLKKLVCFYLVMSCYVSSVRNNKIYILKYSARYLRPVHNLRHKHRSFFSWKMCKIYFSATIRDLQLLLSDDQSFWKSITGSFQSSGCDT